VDGVLWEQYQENLEENLRGLHVRVMEGSYKPRPSLRTYIPKGDGGMRPLGIASLEDKIVQQAVAEILTVIYEVDFKDCSYGFRPGIGCHDALDDLYIAITRRKVNWVLDADIRKYFDSMDHGWLIRFLKHRIGDHRIIRLIKNWLNAGYIDDGQWYGTDVGSAQGAVISPLLANVYLHYALDLWVNNFRRVKARGEVHFFRYADDFVVCFQYRDDARRFHVELKERLEKFKLSLHSDKTRLIEFGRFAAENRRARGERKPETFDFLGFTHICSVTRKNKKFKLLRITISKRWKAKLVSLESELRKRINWSIAKVGKWLNRVVIGYFNYYAVHDNLATLGRFRYLLAYRWMKIIRRRSHRQNMTWDRFVPIVKAWLPQPKARPLIQIKDNASDPTEEPVASTCSPGSVRGDFRKGVPTAKWKLSQFYHHQKLLIQCYLPLTWPLEISLI
jgi:group II intron reverse transcriptase/maturase